MKGKVDEDTGWPGIETSLRPKLVPHIKKQMLADKRERIAREKSQAAAEKQKIRTKKTVSTNHSKCSVSKGVAKGRDKLENRCFPSASFTDMRRYLQSIPRTLHSRMFS